MKAKVKILSEDAAENGDAHIKVLLIVLKERVCNG